MKKILLCLVLTGLLFSPLLVSAQVGPRECCKLRRDVEFGGKIYKKDLVLTPRAMKQDECDLLPDTFKTTPTLECVDADGNGIIDQTNGCYISGWGLPCLLSTIYYITNWIFTILLLVSVIMVIIGGFQMVTAAGSEEKFTSGRNYVMYAAIGVGVAVAARIVPAVVRAVMGI